MSRFLRCHPPDGSDCFLDHVSGQPVIVYQKDDLYHLFYIQHIRRSIAYLTTPNVERREERIVVRRTRLQEVRNFADSNLFVIAIEQLVAGPEHFLLELLL